MTATDSYALCASISLYVFSTEGEQTELSACACVKRPSCFRIQREYVLCCNTFSLRRRHTLTICQSPRTASSYAFGRHRLHDPPSSVTHRHSMRTKDCASRLHRGLPIMPSTFSHRHSVRTNGSPTYQPILWAVIIAPSSHSFGLVGPI